MVQASRSDKAEFVKLVHLTDGNSMRNGYLLDLHVSMLGSEAEDEEENHSEDIQILLQKVDRRIETLQHLAQDAKQFMEDNKEALDALAFDDEGNESSQYSPWPSPANSSRQPSSKSIHSIKEVAAAAAAAEEIKKKRSAFSLNTTSSSTTTTTSSSSSLTGGGQQRHYSSSIRRVPSSLLLDPHNLPYGSVNPFDYRQEEVRLGVCALESEMTDFKRELQGTQDLIRDIQIDINDTRQRMSLYIKDIPETHYSALKKLEVDVESILANRAKNPWLDTGYALLSYLLTLFALLVWIIICGLKWGRTVILFPRKLWRTYTEYLVERDKAVKKASLRSVSPGSNRNSRHLHHHHAVASDTLSRPSRPPLTSASSSSLSSRPKSRTIVNQHHLHSPCLEQS
ncbi:hypothetical protein BDB00DRAFT_827986 [Zychaea mexicana]|uniref:uncharacterized protein n=1 Tax=Zychaea mexicana TaxID=64656 RepID=UPI0022FF0BC9|nr:uncharacterized protein BDB00DRAFT_827986 [Zychaea mexicana]KAI9492570.1 hypothetical protein BDB00DRAFT_827986 [Zychaea mexicana]